MKTWQQVTKGRKTFGEIQAELRSAERSAGPGRPAESASLEANLRTLGESFGYRGAGLDAFVRGRSGHTTAEPGPHPREHTPLRESAPEADDDLVDLDERPGWARRRIGAALLRKPATAGGTVELREPIRESASGDLEASFARLGRAFGLSEPAARIAARGR